ncbi:MAG: hypothetical protein Kow0092_40560 [Deferrisomatales bacterium]
MRARLAAVGLALLLGCGSGPGSRRPEYFGADTRPLATEVDGAVDLPALEARGGRRTVTSYEAALIDAFNESVFRAYGEPVGSEILVDYLRPEEMLEVFGPYAGFADLAHRHLYVADNLPLPPSFSVLAHEYGHLRGPAKKEYIAKITELRVDGAAWELGMGDGALFVALSKLGIQFLGLSDAGPRYARAASAIVDRLARGEAPAAVEEALRGVDLAQLNRYADQVMGRPLEAKRELLRAAYGQLLAAHPAGARQRARELVERLYGRASEGRAGGWVGAHPENSVFRMERLAFGFWLLAYGLGIPGF